MLSGAVTVGDHVTISPSGLSARVRSIHAQNRAAERGEAGQRCALNLAGDGITKDAIARGDVVLDPELHRPTDRIDASLRVLATEQKPITQWMPVRLHHAAIDVAARVVLLGDTPVAPGAEASRAARAGTPDRGRRARPLRAARYHGAAHDRGRPLPRSARTGAQAPHAGAPRAA